MFKKKIEAIGSYLSDHEDEVMVGGYAAMIGAYVIFMIGMVAAAFAGKFKFRNIELENRLIGAHLPLSSSTIATFLLEAESVFNEIADEADAKPILKKQFWNLVGYSLELLT